MSRYRNLDAKGCRAVGAWLFASALAALIAGCDRLASGGASASQTAAKAADDCCPPGEAGHDHEHSDEVRLTPEAIERHGVRVETATLRALVPRIAAPARVTLNAEAVAHVGSPLRGRIAERRIRLGDLVRKGDELFVIESPELGEAQSDFLQKRILADAAQPAVELAAGALERVRKLHEQGGGIALDEVRKREQEHRAALAAHLAARAAAQAAENRLHLLGMDQPAVDALRDSGEVRPRLALRAPIGGQVIEVEATLGELVGPERESLLTLADLSTLWVLADVPEARLVQVAPGARTWIDAGSLDPHRHEGRVSYIAPLIDSRTRTVAVRAAVQCEDGALRPGMFVQMEIAETDPTRAEPTPVIAVPAEAVQTFEGRSVVFVPVENEENAFAPRPVTIGRTVGGLLPIVSGLSAGERFVAGGSFILKAELGKAGAEHSCAH